MGSFDSNTLLSWNI